MRLADIVREVRDVQLRSLLLCQSGACIYTCIMRDIYVHHIRSMHTPSQYDSIQVCMLLSMPPLLVCLGLARA